MATVTPTAARRPRAYVRVNGPDAVDYLNRMLSNDVPEQGSVDALLLTPKARVIAPVLVWRRGVDDVLLLTHPGLGAVARGGGGRRRLPPPHRAEAGGAAAGPADTHALRGEV